jgi:hypothetical protein
MNSKIEILTQDKYQQFLSEGYIEATSKPMVHCASKGRFVQLYKPLSTCERVGRMAACIFICPLSFPLSAVTCGVIKCIYEPCVDHLVVPSIDGCYPEEGYLKNNQLTKELRDKDFEELGYNDGFTRENFINLAESDRYPIIQSRRFPQHCYILFYGLASNFSYAITIPNHNTKLASFYPIHNDAGKPCNTEEGSKQAEILCGGYKPGAKSIKVVTEKHLVGSTRINTAYGTFTGAAYAHEQRIESTD